MKLKYIIPVLLLILLAGCATGPSQAEYDALQEQLEEARAAKEAAERSVDDWEKHAKEFEQRYNDAVLEQEKLTEQNESLQEQNQLLAAENDSLQKESDDLEKSAKESEQRYNDAVLEKEKLAKQNAFLQEQSELLVSEIADLQDQNEELRKEIVDARALIENQEKQINDPSHILTLTEYAHLEAENEDLRNRLEAALEKQDKEIAEAQSKIQSLEDNLKTSEAANADLQKKLNDALAEISRLQDIIVDQTNEIRDIRYRLTVREQDLERYLQSQQ